MKRLISIMLISTILLLFTTMMTGAWTVPDTGQTESYTGVFGEDSDYNINPPSFTDNGNGTVTDNVTGFIWQQEDDGVTRSWDDAVKYCEELDLATFTDWRLPDVEELKSIVNYGTYDPAIDERFFPGANKMTMWYWSSTRSAEYPSEAWFVAFSNGESRSDGAPNNYRDTYVRCVRGGE